MLTAEENERMSRVGPGTPMGDLLRRYWHPVAATSQLPSHGTRPVRLLGEDLVLYRDRQGKLGLVGDRCPHRRAGMVFGIPEQNGLRCAYHGWLFSETGRCLEQPYEQTEDPASTFRDRVTITAYPVEELAGLIFAYLGPLPAPLLPRWDVFAMQGVMRDIGATVIPCNWLQCMENSLDPVHVEWLHTHFSDYVLERLGRPDLKRRAIRNGVRDDKPWKHEKIGFTVFEHGITKRRVLEGGTEDDEDWKVGHPIVFPNILRTLNAFQMRVPIDDTHTWHVWYTTYEPGPGLEYQPQDTIPYYDVPVAGVDANGEPQWSLLDNNSGQDMAMWYTQGDIADRSQEHLGISDKGIIIYRNLLKENIERVARGEDPMNVFRDPEENDYIWLPVEKNSYRFGDRGNLRVNRSGQASKYSPVLKDAVVRTRGEEALLEPVH
ncbi:MAG TPA: Rieske 2Fe-2S domain-containing protein [Chloroflexota bacterium]|nr:Rieske 2Fe-2S domain-containing protein [Chloroflexota bacterium]